SRKTSSEMIIESSAPTRCDLAGGTIDIWPLYLFHRGATTVNFALSLRARVRIETRNDGRIILESRDRNVMVETSVDRIDDLARDEKLELVSKMVHFFRPETGFHLVAHSEAPAGAGIAGSSALVIGYTGEPRLSGINNWESFKRHIDGDAELFDIFERIRDAAVRMRAALLANDWDEVAATMRAAYPVRKRLAPGITTPQMDMLVAKALANGGESGKV